MRPAIERLDREMLGRPEARGHWVRYRLAARCVRPGDVVNDVACGIGYGSTLLMAAGAEYHGYDRPEVCAEAAHDYPDADFHGCDLDAASWYPLRVAAVTVCTETLEHLTNPWRVAERLSDWTRRAVVVSVPSVPTLADNPHHRHDLDVRAVPAMFPGFSVAAQYEQRREHAHVWILER